MRTTKVFKSGNSQAVRLPKDFQFKGNIVMIFKKNGDVIIREKPRNLAAAFEVLTHFSNDFFEEGRNDTLPQERDYF